MTDQRGRVIRQDSSALGGFPSSGRLIGVGRSAYAPWSPPVTVQDARAIRAVLTDPGLCAYPDDHIRLLHDDQATRGAMLEGFDWLDRQVAAEPHATAVVYFSGHGWLEETTGRYFL